MATPLLTKALSAHLTGVVPIRPLPTYINNRVLGAAAETETVPAGYSFVVIGTTADLWVDPTNTAATPAADVTNGAGRFLIAAASKEAFGIATGQALSVIAPSGTAIVSFEYYAAR
jgi:uncharacterized protein YcgI (DUF1989 family)